MTATPSVIEVPIRSLVIVWLASAFGVSISTMGSIYIAEHPKEAAPFPRRR